MAPQFLPKLTFNSFFFFHIIAYFHRIKGHMNIRQVPILQVKFVKLFSWSREPPFLNKTQELHVDSTMSSRKYRSTAKSYSSMKILARKQVFSDLLLPLQWTATAPLEFSAIVKNLLETKYIIHVKDCYFSLFEYKDFVNSSMSVMFLSNNSENHTILPIM